MFSDINSRVFYDVSKKTLQGLYLNNISLIKKTAQKAV